MGKESINRVCARRLKGKERDWGEDEVMYIYITAEAKGRTDGTADNVD